MPCGVDRLEVAGGRELLAYFEQNLHFGKLIPFSSINVASLQESLSIYKLYFVLKRKCREVRNRICVFRNA